MPCIMYKRNTPWIHRFPLWPRFKVRWPWQGHIWSWQFKTDCKKNQEHIAKWNTWHTCSTVHTLPQKKCNFPWCISLETECTWCIMGSGGSPLEKKIQKWYQIASEFLKYILVMQKNIKIYPLSVKDIILPPLNPKFPTADSNDHSLSSSYKFQSSIKTCAITHRGPLYFDAFHIIVQKTVLNTTFTEYPE